MKAETRSVIAKFTKAHFGEPDQQAVRALLIAELMKISASGGLYEAFEVGLHEGTTSAAFVEAVKVPNEYVDRVRDAIGTALAAIDGVEVTRLYTE